MLYIILRFTIFSIFFSRTTIRIIVIVTILKCLLIFLSAVDNDSRDRHVQSLQFICDLVQITLERLISAAHHLQRATPAS